jgi:hypothetical protein
LRKRKGLIQISPTSAAEFLNCFHRFGKVSLGFRREDFAEIQFQSGNGQAPSLRRLAENVACQQRARVAFNSCVRL